MKIGSIPLNLRFHVRSATKVRFRWEDMEEKELTSKSYDVYPTYVADAKNKKTNETGEKWANESMATWNGKAYVKPPSNATVVDLPNEPFTDIKIMDLEIRGQGGRAYKVLIDGKYYVDLREDVLLDTIFECGISKGGILKGEFIFAVVGSQMKLIRVGSLLHEKLIESTAAGNAKGIKTFEVGGVYARKSGTFVYAGLFNSRKMVGEIKEVSKGSYYGKQYEEVITGKGKVEPVHLFIADSYAKNIVKDGKLKDWLGFAIIKDTSSFKVREKEDVDISPYIDQIVDKVRTDGMRHFGSGSLHYRNPKKPNYEGEPALSANISKESDYVNPLFKLS